MQLFILVRDFAKYGVMHLGYNPGSVSLFRKKFGTKRFRLNIQIKNPSRIEIFFEIKAAKKFLRQWPGH